MNHEYVGPSYILSVDLGQAADPSAVAVLEKTPVAGGLARYAVADSYDRARESQSMGAGK